MSKAAVASIPPGPLPTLSEARVKGKRGKKGKMEKRRKEVVWAKGEDES